MTVYPLGIVGESAYQPAVRRTSEGEVARICHEVGNPYDDMALRVENSRGEVIGYISMSSWLRRAIHDEGRGAAATIKAITASPEGSDLGVVLDVTLTDDDIPMRRWSAKSDKPSAPTPTTPLGRIYNPPPTHSPNAFEYLDTLARASVFPVTCDCGAIYRVGLSGMTLTTVLDCPACKSPNTLDAETFDRLRDEYLTSAKQLLAAANIKPHNDATILAKLGAATRTPIELVSPKRAPKPWLWKRWLGG